MTTLGPRVDAAQLRVVLQRLSELDAEVHGVTDTVLDYLPYVDAGAATETPLPARVFIALPAVTQLLTSGAALNASRRTTA